VLHIEVIVRRTSDFERSVYDHHRHVPILSVIANFLIAAIARSSKTYQQTQALNAEGTMSSKVRMNI